MDQILGDSPATVPKYVVFTNQVEVPVKKAVAMTPKSSKRLLEEQQIMPSSSSQSTQQRAPLRKGSLSNAQGMSYEQYLMEKSNVDAKKADNDSRRTDAIVDLVDCFKKAAEKENHAPHTKMKLLAEEFISAANSLLGSGGCMEVEETVSVFRDVVLGLKRSENHSRF